MQDEEASMFTLFEMTPDLVCIVSKEGYFIKTNSAVSDKLGYTEEELKAAPVHTFIHPDDKERTARERAKLLTNQPLLNFQNRYCNKCGESIWLEWTSIYLPEKELVFAIAKDITVRKQKEMELRENYTRFQHLTRHLKNGIEKDRRQIAINLQDDLAQLATAIKTGVEWMSAQELSPTVRLQLQSLSKTANLLVNNIRNLSYAVSPASVADLGLDAALQSLCTEFSAVTGTSCNYSSSFNEEALSYEIKLDIYRLSQEALLNIMQHAEASFVSISLHDKNGGLQLFITDNGRGFDQQGTSSLAKGLSVMHGRALSINGRLNIMSNDNGTSLELLITPMDAYKN